MARSTLKVLLDSNVFSKKHFDELESSRFRELCARRRIEAVYSGEMLEETLRGYSVEGVRDELIARWIPMILDTVTVFCDVLPSIWHKELVKRQGRKASERLTSDAHLSVVDHLKALARDGSSPLFEQAIPEWREGDATRQQRRGKSLALRAKVAQVTREGLATLDAYRLNPAQMAIFEQDIARSMIERHVAPNDLPLVVFRRWERDRAEYPYFTQFVKNVAYQEVLFATEHDLKVDVNAQPDLDILTHLLRADLVVTNETRFMKRAHADIWRPKRKVLMTSSEFARYLELL